MRETKAARRLAAGISFCAVTLLMVMHAAAQSDPAAEQATVDALVQQYFDQTATATAEFDQTQTLEAAFEAAQTATAVFDSTVQAAFEQAASATQQALPTPEATPVPERVVATHPLELTAGMMGRTAFLSPDGTRLAHVDGRALCIYTVEGVEELCISLQDHELPVDPEHIVWSPDGRSLAMTEDFFLRLYESDVWVLDADSGTLTNITDDGAVGGFSSSEYGSAPKDVTPTWLADGRIAFLRFQSDQGDMSASIYAIQPDGSELELLASITDNEGATVYSFDISRDGRYLAYNWTRSSEDKASGLWLRDLESGEEHLLFRAENPAFVPHMISFSPDGQYVMWMDGRFGTLRAPSEPEDSPMRAIAVEGGEPMLLDENTLVYVAWWAADGHALAYLVRDPRNADISGLYVSAVPGEGGTRVLEGMYMPPILRYYVPNLWSENNTILLSNAPEAGMTVVQLGD